MQSYILSVADEWIVKWVIGGILLRAETDILEKNLPLFTTETTQTDTSLDTPYVAHKTLNHY
jgi:hypothetical protein